MKRVLAWVLTLVLLAGCAGAETAITINGMRTAFFDEQGNYLPQQEMDGLLYVPLQSFAQSLGMTAEAQGQRVTVDGVQIGMFTADGSFVGPKLVNEVAYVPLLPFCEAVGVAVTQSDTGLAIVNERETVAAEPQQPETARVVIHTGNFATYFAYSITPRDFYMVTTKYKIGTSLAYSNKSQVTYDFTCSAKSVFEVDNVKFTVSGSMSEYTRKITGLGGVSFSGNVPVSGVLNMTKQENGSAMLGYQDSTRSVSLQSTSVKSASGFIVLPYEEAQAANQKTFEQAERYAANNDLTKAQTLFAALAEVDYPGAQEKADEITVQKKAADEQRRAEEAAAAKKRQEEEAAAAAKLAQEQEAAYQQALTLENEQKYEEAIALYEGELLKNYKDAADRIAACQAGIPEREYQKAVALMAAGGYEEAIAAFEALGEYQDCADQITECRYQQALVLLAAEKEDEAYALLLPLKDYKDTANLLAADQRLINAAARKFEQDTAPGGRVVAGTYNGEPIEWLVCQRDGRNALLLATKGLFKKQIHAKETTITWEKCDLRKYLNNDFLQSAFTPEQQTAIRVTVNKNLDGNYQKKKSEGGPDTKDTIFLLGYDEWKKEWRLEGHEYCWSRTLHHMGQIPGNKRLYRYEFYFVTKDLKWNEEDVDAKMWVAPAMWADIYDLTGTKGVAGISPEKVYEEMKKGSTGGYVTKLQAKLIEMELLKGEPTGKFDDKTVAAVKKAQKQLGLKQTGKADNELMHLLFPEE